jgi:hypothetical protein
MYLPRAREALRRFVQTLAEDERQILASSQFTLDRNREISQLFIDGILGDNFPRPLSFYLSRYKEYLESIKGLAFGENLADAAAEPTPTAPLLSVAAAPVRESSSQPAQGPAN